MITNSKMENWKTIVEMSIVCAQHRPASLKFSTHRQVSHFMVSELLGHPLHNWLQTLLT